MPKSALRSYLLFTGSGPILVLSTYPKLTDERLVDTLRFKGIERFIAYEVDLDAVVSLYAERFERMKGEIAHGEDFRVLDFDGHQIMAKFSLDALGDPIKYGG